MISLFVQGVLASDIEDFTKRLRLDGCTSMAFGKDATSHGYPVATHVNDCEDCDNRMAHVAAQDHAINSSRLVFDGAWLSFPRQTDHSRSPIYSSSAENIPSSRAIGSIPQVEHTFALWESSYPLINEHGLAFGESTTEANHALAAAGMNHLNPISNHEGRALFAISSLMAIALERCKTARCAITTMGELAEEYGFFGEVFGASEALSVIDKGETWVFEIISSGEEIGALWVAQRVPEDHVAVIANSMIIGNVHPNDTSNFIVSKNLFSRTQELGLYDGVSPFNWKKVMSAEKGQPLYAALRMWRVFTRCSSTFDYPVPRPGELADYPFSVKVDQKLGIEEIINLHRDHYEGTEYDMTKGVMAGPWGNPNYEFSGLEFRDVPGEAPRAISVMRTSYCEVSTSGNLAKVWYGIDAPTTSVFVPFYAEADRFSAAYGSAEYPNLKRFDRVSAFWAFDFVANWMGINYRNMSQEMVYPARNDLQRFVFNQSEIAEKEAMENPRSTKTILGNFQSNIQEEVVKQWWELSDELIVRYNDGFFNFGKYHPESVGSIPYPVWWLRMIGFDDSFYKPSNHFVKPAGPEAFTSAMNGITPSIEHHPLWPLVLAFCMAPFIFLAGSSHGRQNSMKKSDLTDSLIL